MPMADFDSGTLSEIALEIEEQHKFSVSTYTAMGVNGQIYDMEHKQYVTNEIARATHKVLSDHGISFCEKSVIVLTNKDLNNADFRLRYVFSSHFDRACMSVISTARINPVNYGNPKNERLVTQRLMKLINKSIGLNDYKYKVSSDKSNVMYGPVMSPLDLDKVGGWYGG